MILVADSGSTKTKWVSEHHTITTKGINPVRDTMEEIHEVIRTELMPFLVYENGNQAIIEIDAIYFYGAGCIEPFSNSVSQALKSHFPKSEIIVQSDLLGAARALCGKKEGIACILGTGSNSCMCKHGEIVSNTSPLGYILGDEGSGAVLGRTILSELLKGELKELWEDFSKETGLSVTDIINKVYRQPQANRFLASLTPFIKRHIERKEVRNIVVQEFKRFIVRNVLPYGRLDLPINFVGGIANNFKEELELACEQCGMKMGKINGTPAEEIYKFHISAI